MDRKKVAVIGGGITGLASAFYLQKYIKENDLNMECTLYESSSRLGGKIKTDYTNGNIMELGPDSLIATKKSSAQLAKDVGLEKDIVSNNYGKTYILHDGTLHSVPGGAIMGIPTEISPFIQTKLISPIGKGRAAGDLLLPRIMKEDKDISLGTFFRKRLGNEVVDRLIDPLLSGVYSGDIDQLSLRATFPHFEQLEKKHRSLMIGMKASRAKRKATNKNKQQKKMFISLKNGLSSLVHAVESKLDNGSVRKNSKLIRLWKENNKYRLQFENGIIKDVDYVVMATPHFVTYEIFQHHSFATYLKEIPANSKATIVLAYEKSAIKKDINGSGFIVASKKDHAISACTWTHKKWEHTAKDGYALLRAYVGGAYDHQTMKLSDDEILEIVLKELNSIMKIEGKPVYTNIQRWWNSLPQYRVGHVDEIRFMNKEMEKEFPGIFLAGAAYEGIGVPDCIDSGKRAIEKIIAIYKSGEF